MAEAPNYFEEKEAELKAAVEGIDAKHKESTKQTVGRVVDEIFDRVQGVEREASLRWLFDQCGVKVEFDPATIKAHNDTGALIDRFVDDPNLTIDEKLVLVDRFIRISEARGKLAALRYLLEHSANKRALLQEYVDKYGYCGQECGRGGRDLANILAYASHDEIEAFFTLCMGDGSLTPVLIEYKVQDELRSRRIHKGAIDRGPLAGLLFMAQGDENEAIPPNPMYRALHDVVLL